MSNGNANGYTKWLIGLAVAIGGMVIAGAIGYGEMGSNVETNKACCEERKLEEKKAKDKAQLLEVEVKVNESEMKKEFKHLGGKLLEFRQEMRQDIKDMTRAIRQQGRRR